MKAMRAFHGVSAALLKQFLSTGPKTFEQIERYLDTACLHPTGHHWVNNFLLPTLLVHQFECAEREGNILEASDPGTYDEVLLSCRPCSVCSLSHPVPATICAHLILRPRWILSVDTMLDSGMQSLLTSTPCSQGTSQV